MSLIKASLAGNKRVILEQWDVVERQSAEYVDALSLDRDDIQEMGNQGLVVRVVVQVNNVSVEIFAKCVCTPHNDGRASFGGDTPGWKTILQARLPEDEQFSTGGGTTYFTTLPPDIHQQVMEKLREEEYELGGGATPSLKVSRIF